MVQVVLITNTRFYREGLAAALDRVPSLRVVGQSCSWQEALPVVRDERPEVVLLDVPGSDAAQAIRAVTAISTAAKVIALSVDEVERDVLPLAEAGIAGYVTRESSLDAVVEVIDTVARGELTCSPRIAASLLNRVGALARSRGSNGENLLTPRELEIVGLIGCGLSNREIGEQLYIERSTVKNHIHNILEKLHVTGRSDAVAWARSKGAVSDPLTPPPP